MTGSGKTAINGMVCFLDCGGPIHVISVNGKRYRFEMHPYCGPNVVNRKGDPLKHQPTDFLKAASLWAQQGQQVENGLCVWFHEPEPILKHLGGNHFQIIGHKPAVRGE